MSSQQGRRTVGPYDVLHSKPVYENPWVKVREDRVSRRGHEDAVFGVITMKPGVSVLPLDDDGQVYLVREFKYGIGSETLEVVSGGMESGEKPEHAGLRELAEECRLVASEWIDMGLVNPFTTIVDSPNYMFLARQLSQLRPTFRGGEEADLEVVKIPFEQALTAVLEGEITHAASCVVILKTQLFLTRNRR
jgi:ADP-ribose pyrophosphatase